jgi:hypothetical protein
MLKHPTFDSPYAAPDHPDVIPRVCGASKLLQPIGILDQGVVVEQHHVTPWLEESQRHVVASYEAKVLGIEETADPRQGLQIIYGPVCAAVVDYDNLRILATSIAKNAVEASTRVVESVPS